MNVALDDDLDLEALDGGLFEMIPEEPAGVGLGDPLAGMVEEDADDALEAEAAAQAGAVGILKQQTIVIAADSIEEAGRLLKVETADSGHAIDIDISLSDGVKTVKVYPPATAGPAPLTHRIVWPRHAPDPRGPLPPMEAWEAGDPDPKKRWHADVYSDDTQEVIFSGPRGTLRAEVDDGQLDDDFARLWKFLGGELPYDRAVVSAWRFEVPEIFHGGPANRWAIRFEGPRSSFTLRMLYERVPESLEDFLALHLAPIWHSGWSMTLPALDPAILSPDHPINAVPQPEPVTEPELEGEDHGNPEVHGQDLAVGRLRLLPSGGGHPDGPGGGREREPAERLEDRGALQAYRRSRARRYAQGRV